MVAENVSWPGLAGRVAIVVGLLVVGTAVSWLLPSIDLDTEFADAAVRFTDTGSVRWLPLLCVALVLVLISRPGTDGRRRGLEASVVVVAMVIVLAGNAAVNEFLVKPAIGAPRPNIDSLAEDGILGPEFPDGQSLYEVGGKTERRAVLAERLTPSSTPALSALVRAHWIHETGFSLPSGHATAATTFAALWVGIGLAWLRSWRRWLVVTLVPIWAVGIAHSRVALGVHRPIDVFLGALAGLFWGVLAFVVTHRLIEPAPTDDRADAASTA